MEKDSLEEKIMAIRNGFDLKDIPEGHDLRFERKLRRAKNLSASVFKAHSRWVKVAAALAICLSIAGTIGLLRKEKPQPISAWETELNELEVYYTTRYQEEFSRLENYNLTDYEFARQLKQDLDQIEQSNENFREMILREGKNEYLIDAMIENYQMKLKILRKLKKLIEKTEKNYETDQDPS
ncbi:MAG: hypothetical protein SF052_23725 [Bacteroidia bacterium]|nr:hypothetical protein [Bacteroidia bacterium]